MRTDVMGPWRRSLGLICLVVVPLAGVAQLYGDAATSAAARVLDDVKYLASDELQGRGVGTDGLDRAADFIRDAMSNAGLQTGIVDGGAFQPFQIVTGAELGEGNALRLVGPDGHEIELTHDQDFRTCSFGGSGTLDAELVFCGYGIEAEDMDYDEFSEIDVSGKAVVVIRRVPRQSDQHGPFTGVHGGLSRHSELRTKVSNAARRGAAAVLIVNDPYTVHKTAADNRAFVEKATQRVVAAAEAIDAVDASDAAALQEARKTLSQALEQLRSAREQSRDIEHDELMNFGYGGTAKDRTTPVLHVKQQAVDQLLRLAVDESLEEIERAIDADLKPRSVVLSGWRAVGQTSVLRTESKVKNVIGVLEGEGPLADETIVVGAHYDHLGLGGEGSLSPELTEVHNGADDNASGSAALLELARRIASRGKKLSRRLVFVAFTAEERGLLGSEHYVKYPPYPLDKTVAMFNMDMVGRLDDNRLTIFGTGTSPRWDALLDDLAAQSHFKLAKKPDGFGPSDQSSFYSKRIPVLHFFTGTHSDYHRPSDDWDKINVEGMLRVIDMIEQVVVETAETPARPEYSKVERKSAAARSGSRPYFGSIPDFGGESPGYAISGVSPGSPADNAGLKGGDSIVEFGGQKIEGLDDFDLALRRYGPGDEVEVAVLRNGEEVRLKVTLAKPK